MGLEFKVENLDGVDEAHRGLYEQQEDGSFQLGVSGIDTGEELKGALRKEREARKEADRKLAEINRQKDEADTATLLEKEQYKELYEKEKGEKEVLKDKLVNEKKDSFIELVVNSLTAKPKKAKVLRKEISQNLEVEDGEVKIVGLAEVGNREQLENYYREEFDFLTDGSQATGGGATGNRGGGSSQKVLTQEQFNALSPAEKMHFHTKQGGVIKD